MIYPESVDLRENIDSVYDQSDSRACYPHAVVNALEIMQDRNGTSERYSKSHLWYWSRKWNNLQDKNVGVTFNDIQRTLREVGVAKSIEYPWNYSGSFSANADKQYRIVRSNLDEGLVNGIKRLLCTGLPVVWLMKVTPMFNALAFYKDWKTSPDIPPDVSQVIGEHAVCIVGYDDTYQRFLVENSYGEYWGDGGFFGVPYTSMQALTESVQHIDESNLKLNPVKGYSMQVPFLTLTQSSAFTERSSEYFKEILMSEFNVSPQAMIDKCIKIGISDKHLEQIFGWNRGTVRQFKLENNTLNWTNFVLDQL